MPLTSQKSTAREKTTAIQKKKRKEPGIGGTGEYYRIIVRPKEDFSTFRMHDVGAKGHIQRLAGRKKTGEWDTQAWLVAKDDAHVRGKKLILDNDAMLQSIRGPITHVQGDVYKAKPRMNHTSGIQTTEAQRRARRENIKKARAARQKLYS